MNPKLKENKQISKPQHTSKVRQNIGKKFLTAAKVTGATLAAAAAAGWAYMDMQSNNGYLPLRRQNRNIIVVEPRELILQNTQIRNRFV